MSYIADPLQELMPAVRDENRQNTALATMTLRLFLKQERLARMTGNQPLMVSMYTTKLLVRGAHKIYGEEQNIAGSTDANMCTVRCLNLFEHQSEETQLAAIFLQFDPPHFLEDASLYLSFFLRGKSRAITDFASFLKAMEGLEEFLVVFYR
jgi:hypothetical protein